jgi:hypothetical protein
MSGHASCTLQLLQTLSSHGERWPCALPAMLRPATARMDGVPAPLSLPSAKSAHKHVVYWPQPHCAVTWATLLLQLRPLTCPDRRTLSQQELFSPTGPQNPPSHSTVARRVYVCSSHVGVPLHPGIQECSRGDAAQHRKLCVPFGFLRVLAQLRFGWAHLEVEQGRKHRPKVPREAILCRLCSGDDLTFAMRQAVLPRTGSSAHVEDLKHGMSCV